MNSSRRKTRKYIVQALYSWQISKNKIQDIKIYFLKKKKFFKIDTKYFKNILIGVIKNIKKIDFLIKNFIFRNIKQLGEIEKAVLRMSFYELFHRKDIPYKVVINEGIESVKKFGSKDSYKFINGVLNKVVKKIHLIKKK
ncbi:Transcription antitermination protein NusB [Buchnera aphidicola (Drepanosiphum platanoidis)]